MTELTITLASHHFTITGVSARARSVVNKFSRRFILYKKVYSRFGGRPEVIGDRIFAAKIQDGREYRFHINQLEGFKDYLRLDYITDSMVNYVVRPSFEVEKVDIKIRDGWEIWPDQEGAATYCSDDEPVRKMLSMGTGTGKSFVSMHAASTAGVRSVYLVRAGYIEKWVRDFNKSLDLGPEDLMVIRGTEALQQLLVMSKAGMLRSKLILVSNRTFQNWLTAYEKWGSVTLSMGYPILPDQFFETLKAGMRFIDEVHEDFHLNFLIDLYTHVWRSVSMSATLKADDSFINQMYELAYPLSERFEGPKGRKYISCTTLSYRFADPERLKSQGAQGYSHTTFEKSLMKNKLALKNYVDMIAMIVQVEFMNDFHAGEKILVYASTTELCSHLARELAVRFPTVGANRYCGSLNDDFLTLMDAPLSVTTLKSAGTNMDIPGLRVVVLTTAIKSSQGNIQGFGRLRDNLPDGRQCRFITTVCLDIMKHVTYQQERDKILKDKALSQAQRAYTKLL